VGDPGNDRAGDTNSGARRPRAEANVDSLEGAVTTSGRRRPTRTQAVYVISVAAELAGMHPQTLRIYERRGLVMPARTKGGNRRYSEADIAILHRIAELTNEGMNLEGIRRIMSLEAENRRLRAELEHAREIALHAISDADRRQSGGDLVPVRQALAVYGNRSTSLDDD
jgi:MerR family transcriptional regulator/heat shock protein HspR